MLRWMLLLVLVLLPTALLAVPTRPADRFQPDPEQSAREEPAVPEQAHVNGRYRGLLRVLHAPQEAAANQRFLEWGWWNGNVWAGHRNLPSGYWVYVYPNWYIWQERNPGR